jgi:hypothetical protein
MGLTIHWEQKNPKEKIDIKKATECIEFIEFIAEKAGWEVLGKWNEVVRLDRYEMPDHREARLPQPSGGIARQMGISVHPHPDCESVVISFDTTNGKLRHYYDFGRPDQIGWIMDSTFCKTHYAGFAVHKQVCRLLEAISKRYIELEVSDEGDYYGIWDDEKGKKVFGEYVAFVKGVGDQIKNNFGGDNVIDSHDSTSGWKEDYIDHLAEEFKNKKYGNKTAKTNAKFNNRDWVGNGHSTVPKPTRNN